MSSCPAVLQIEALKLITKAELVSWFMEHRDTTSKKLSVHVSLPALTVCVRARKGGGVR